MDKYNYPKEWIQVKIASTKVVFIPFIILLHYLMQYNFFRPQLFPRHDLLIKISKYNTINVGYDR